MGRRPKMKRTPSEGHSPDGFVIMAVDLLIRSLGKATKEGADMDIIFVTGTAGAGKSMLSGALKNWYVNRGESAIAVNLDPGVADLPYDPDVDVKDRVELRQVMEEYGLGPNGGLVLAADLVATKLGEIQEDIESFRPEYVVVDTPGQTELFAYRESGEFIVRESRADSKVLLFLLDPLLAGTPSNFL